jgi:hypothetical protein
MNPILYLWLGGLFAFELTVCGAAVVCLRHGLRPVSILGGWTSYRAARGHKNRPRLLVWYERLELAALSYIVLTVLAWLAWILLS